jgi:hypothetical protein
MRIPPKGPKTEAEPSVVRNVLASKDLTHEVLAKLPPEASHLLAQVNRQTRTVVHQEALSKALTSPAAGSPVQPPKNLFNPLWVKNAIRSPQAAAVNVGLHGVGDYATEAALVALSILTLPTIIPPVVFMHLFADHSDRLPNRQLARNEPEPFNVPEVKRMHQNAAAAGAVLGLFKGQPAQKLQKTLKADDVDPSYLRHLARPHVVAAAQHEQLQAAVSRFARGHHWDRLQAILEVAPNQFKAGLVDRQLAAATKSAIQTRHTFALRWLVEQGAQVSPVVLQKLMNEATLPSRAHRMPPDAVENLLAVGATLPSNPKVDTSCLGWAYGPMSTLTAKRGAQQELAQAQAAASPGETQQFTVLAKRTAEATTSQEAAEAIEAALDLANATQQSLTNLMTEAKAAADGPHRYQDAARALLSNIAFCAACARKARGFAQSLAAAELATGPGFVPQPEAEKNKYLKALTSPLRLAVQRGLLGQRLAAAALARKRADGNLVARQEDVDGPAQSWAVSAARFTEVETIAAVRVAYLVELQARTRTRQAWADRAHSLLDQGDFAQLNGLIRSGLPLEVAATGELRLSLADRLKEVLSTAINERDWPRAQAAHTIVPMMAQSLREVYELPPALLEEEMGKAIDSGRWQDAKLIIALGGEANFSQRSRAHAKLTEAAADGNLEVAEAILNSNFPLLAAAVDWRRVAKKAFTKEYSPSYIALRGRISNDHLCPVKINCRV